ncbi:Hypothetical protein SRAE_1000298700 [Strongyloides ratti]|uniref:Uncharacterized protein n=1 Tax=Strongyloides ratti TaxID=34506 RepID=A0A090MX33_STRRB|nr:Hypothetical protein SRAE_1000298700 [Strongyloides ratti]CEF64734.1 Hypothetical protein SRAE_1000298700 [Strongyloides ratti]
MNFSLTSLGIVIIGAATATILFDTYDSLGLRGNILTLFSGNKETSYENLDAYNLDETGFIPTIFILYAHGKFCYKFYHTHSEKCVTNDRLMSTPVREINKLRRELNKLENHNLIFKEKNVNKGNKDESKKRYNNEENLKSSKKNNKDTDQLYIDLTQIDEDLKKTKKKLT